MVVSLRFFDSSNARRAVRIKVRADAVVPLDHFSDLMRLKGLRVY